MMEDRGPQVQEDSPAQDQPRAQPDHAAANGSGGAPAVAGAVDGAPAEQSLMQQLLDDPSHDYRSLKYGDVLDGTIMQRDRDEFLIDIGSKSEGIIPSKEYSTLTPDEVAQLKVGDQVLVFVVQPENQDGHTVLYGLDNAVWAVPADGSGAPRKLVDSAASPAVTG